MTWSNAPGMNLDWIAVHPEGSDDYLIYAYTGARIEGRLTLGPDALEGSASWPLPPGRYVARLLADDGYRANAESAPFTIR